MKRVGVIGAGPAGLMAAGMAAERGHEVILFEKNDQIGKKLLISGKGRCNITNSAEIDELIENIPGNGDFLYSAFYKFSNRDLIEFFHENHLETKIERGGRVFPVSDRSLDVVNTLHRFIEKSGVRLLLEAPVKSIETEGLTQDYDAKGKYSYQSKIKGLVLENGRKFKFDSIIIATGGVSYPGTGSTGDGYAMARLLGHRVTDLKPGLVPLVTQEEWPTELQGLSLKNIAVHFVNSDGETLYKDFGELLFTHYGVSGPVILSGSRHLLDYGFRNIKLVIDLKPALNVETLDRRLQRDFDKNSRKQFRNSLDELLPGKMRPVITALSGIVPEKPVNQITREERLGLLKLLKNLTMTIKASRPVEEAIVTAGGIAVNEIVPSTMESKIAKGLYFAGEIIDVDAYTGGFNLTIAFSTGYMAGTNC